jgi:hypothetical protein
VSRAPTPHQLVRDGQLDDLGHSLAEHTHVLGCRARRAHRLTVLLTRAIQRDGRRRLRSRSGMRAHLAHAQRARSKARGEWSHEREARGKGAHRD